MPPQPTYKPPHVLLCSSSSKHPPSFPPLPAGRYPFQNLVPLSPSASSLVCVKCTPFCLSTKIACFCPLVEGAVHAAEACSVKTGPCCMMSPEAPRARPAPAAPPAMEPLRRLGRMNMSPLESVGVFWVFCLSAFCFLFCFLYLQYGVVSVDVMAVNGVLWFRRPQQPQERPQGYSEAGPAEGACDLFQGKWVWDDSYPLYEARDCPFLDGGFRCSENGRPDNLYTKWRWQPAHCDLPRFDAKMMLERLRNRRLVFVGDSIGRNQWESLLCLLSSVVPDKSSIYEVNGSPITKHNGFLVFKFRDFNCTIEYYRAPFLVVQSRAPAGLPKDVRTTIKLDVMDWTSSRWRTADMIIFNTGHWWNYEKTIRSGSYFQVGNEVQMEMSIESAYRKLFETLLDWIGREVDTSKTMVIYRTHSPVHFRGYVGFDYEQWDTHLSFTDWERIRDYGGDWKTGGTCHQETLPDLEAPPLLPTYWALQIVAEVISERTRKGLEPDLKVLNITQMTAQRKDGHSSLYYLGPSLPAPVHRQDCSHWCLPGIPDVWNELLYAFSLKWDSLNQQNVTISNASNSKFR